MVTGNYWHLDVVAGVALAAGVVGVQVRLLRARQPNGVAPEVVLPAAA